MTHPAKTNENKTVIRFVETDTDEEIRRCYPVMAQLRPQYGEQEFVDRVKYQQQQGYRLGCTENHDG